MRQYQTGNILLLAVLLTSLLAGYLLARSTAPDGTQAAVRSQHGQAALAQAKDALIGFAVSYRDTHPGEQFGYLPCPDINNDGVADPPCGNENVSALGRLPWNTLGLPPLRDETGECLWYAVAGIAKDNPKTSHLTWDSLGQLMLQDADGQPSQAPAAQDRLWAAIIAPGQPISPNGILQTRANATAPEHPCPGSQNPGDYLEGSDPLYRNTNTPGSLSVLRVSSASSLTSGQANDRALGLLGRELFDRIEKRADFGSAIIEPLLNQIKLCLDNQSASNLPPATGSKGFASLLTWLGQAGNCTALATPDSDPYRRLSNWSEHLLYQRPASGLLINGQACAAALYFGGKANASQKRLTAIDRDNPANYLEGTALTSFLSATPNPNAASTYQPTLPEQDLVRCLTGLPPEQVSITMRDQSNDFGLAGKGASISATDQSVVLGGTSVITGSCLWYPQPLPVAGRSVRAYYRFQFTEADTDPLNDRAYGFTLQFVRNDLNDSPYQSVLCGRAADMGALLTSSTGKAANFGPASLIIEHDIHTDSGDRMWSSATSSQSVGNHVGIMSFGNLDHSLNNGNPSLACNGTQSGCGSPNNLSSRRFEEAPLPREYQQRIEIDTGCNSSCSSCNPAQHAPPNTYARIRLWVDCNQCNDLSSAMTTSASAQRCLDLDSYFNNRLNTAYFGLTGGFRSTPAATRQSVTIRDFAIRSQPPN